MTGRDANDTAVVLLAVVGGLVLVSALVAALLFGGVLLLTAGEDDEDQFTSYPSPDGKLKAVEVASSGGGAPGGYCYRTVAITSAGARSEDARQEDLQVFSAECASFFPRDEAATKSPRIQWISSGRLRITFSTLDMRARLKRVSLRSLDASRSVEVEFATAD